MLSRDSPELSKGTFTALPCACCAIRILEQEQKLTNRLDSLPDDFVFASQGFRPGPYRISDLIFGAAEYSKDGLVPIMEWMGRGSWVDRMEQLITDIWKHAPIDTRSGKLPSDDVEVNGDLLQAMSRLYWLTGDNRYRVWTFRLADHHLLETNLLETESLRLRDHGSEIIGGTGHWVEWRPEQLDEALPPGTD